MKEIVAKISDFSYDIVAFMLPDSPRSSRYSAALSSLRWCTPDQNKFVRRTKVSIGLGTTYAREVSLQQFARYITATRDRINQHGETLVAALGQALPQLRLPCDVGAFVAIKEKQQNQKGAWRKRFLALFSDRWPLLTTLLTIYFDLGGRQISSYKRHTIVERLAAMATRPVDKLHYEVTREFSLLLMGEDIDIADRLLQHVQTFRDTKANAALTQEESDYLSLVLSSLVTFAPSSENLSAALQSTERLLSFSWTDEGRSHVYRRLGDIAKAAQNFAKAAAQYQTAFEYSTSHTDLLFASECLLFNNDLAGAQMLFDRVDFNALDDAGKMDYALILPGFALHSHDREVLDRAKTLLLTTKFKEVYFQDQQVQALAMLERAPNNDTPYRENEASLFQKLLRAIGRYAELKPSVFGIGLNISAMLEDAGGDGSSLHKRSEETSRRPKI